MNKRKSSDRIRVSAPRRDVLVGILQCRLARSLETIMLEDSPDSCRTQSAEELVRDYGIEGVVRSN